MEVRIDLKFSYFPTRCKIEFKAKNIIGKPSYMEY